MQDFNGKVVVVTGAASGIGQALCIALAKRGAVIALSDTNETGLKATEKQLQGSGHFASVLDVANKQAVYEHARDVIAHCGQVDVVINNAGVALSQTIEDLEYDDFEWLMDINFWGVVYGTKAFLPYLRKAQEGWVVNLSSVFGIIAVPTQGAYNASKFAVRGFTEALSQELAGSNVHALSVHPGGIRTNIAASARFYKGPDGTVDQAKASSDFSKLAKTSPASAADQIIAAIENGDNRLLIGKDAKVIDGLQRAMPVRYGNLFTRLQKLMAR